MSDSPLTVAIRHQAGGLSLDVHIRLHKEWTILFGPSGSGKTTILRAVAGLLRPDAGRISDGHNVYFDSAEKIFVPTHLRRVRCAPQNGRLFPHMTVLENIRYGSGWRSKPAEARDLCEQVMASFQMERHRDRRPKQLSGGEQQRACVARALVSAITFDGAGTRPLLLLDEPLSGLDLAVRDAMVAALRRWTSEWKIPVLSVTHSLGEAFQLDAEIVRIADGVVAAQGSAAEVLDEERRHLLGLLQG